MADLDGGGNAQISASVQPPDPAAASARELNSGSAQSGRKNSAEREKQGVR
jgi:hypothetical protein